MAFTGQNVVDRAWQILNDPTGVRWPVADMLRWVNDAQREVVFYVPQANIKTVIRTPAVGTRQTLSGLTAAITDGIQFMGVTRNFDSAGTTPGSAVTPRPRIWLDEGNPNWHNDAAADAKHYIFDNQQDPQTFWLWPKAAGTNKIEVVYSAIPAELAAIGNNLNISDLYLSPMAYYVLFRAMSNVVHGQKMGATAAGYYQIFLQMLGVNDKRIASISGNMMLIGGGTDVSGGAQ